MFQCIGALRIASAFQTFLNTQRRVLLLSLCVSMLIVYFKEANSARRSMLAAFPKRLFAGKFIIIRTSYGIKGISSLLLPTGSSNSVLGQSTSRSRQQIDTIRDDPVVPVELPMTEDELADTSHSIRACLRRRSPRARLLTCIQCARLAHSSVRRTHERTSSYPVGFRILFDDKARARGPP